MASLKKIILVSNKLVGLLPPGDDETQLQDVMANVMTKQMKHQMKNHQQIRYLLF